MKKKFMIPLFAVLAIGMVLAGGFIVNSFVIQSDVYEAFYDIQYYIIGDAGNWDGIEDCEIISENWQTLSGTIPVGGLYPGEGRKLCVKFENLGEADLQYTLSNTVVTGNNNYAECDYAFGENSVPGTALAGEITVAGFGVVVAEDAAAISGCELEIILSRG